MRNWMIAALCTMSLAACGKSKFEKAMAEEGDYKDKLCACTDKDCTEKVWKDYKAWDDKAKNDFTEDDIKNVSEDQMKRAEKQDEELKACHHKFDK
jgi:hypothetical protein